MPAGIRVRLVEVQCDNLNDSAVKDKDKIAIDFTPRELEIVEELIRKASERSQNFEEQTLYHSFVGLFHSAFATWQDMRNKKWALDHPKSVGKGGN
jgi:RNA polymerase-interacting CarD/CdnL/TRCF family regulator